MKAFSKSGWKFGGESTTTSRGGGATAGGSSSGEADPLIHRESTTTAASSYIQSSHSNNNRGNLRERRKSPLPSNMSTPGSSDATHFHATTNAASEPISSYTRIQDESQPQRSRSGNMSLGDNSGGGGTTTSQQSYQHSTGGASAANRSLHSLRRSYLVEKAARDATGVAAGSADSPPLLEIPEEIYAVRKAALQVLKPLTRTWVRNTIRRKKKLCDIYALIIDSPSILLYESFCS